MKRLLILALPFIAMHLAFADSNNQDTMNGYKLSDFGRFYETWHLVTVRFRSDSKEQRFTYANDKAWQALKEKAKVFPDGSVFAKIGVLTQNDPAFTSSDVPSGSMRYQFMVKDSAHHSDTGGWGFAIFDSSGSLFHDDPTKTPAACFACHRIVPERNFVFSQPMSLDPLPAPQKIPPKQAREIVRKNLRFETVSVQKLSPSLRRLLPPGTKKLRSLTGNLRKNFFSGTLDEIRPSLAEEAIASHLPAALISDNGEYFSLVFAAKNHACENRNRRGIELTGAYTEMVVVQDPKMIWQPESPGRILKVPFCYGGSFEQ